MRMVVERAFAISSNATVWTHIGLPPSRIAMATSSPSGPVVSGSTTTSAASSRARSAIVEASGTSPRVFQLSTGPDAAPPGTSGPAGPGAAMTATFPAAKSASTTAMAMPNGRVARGMAKSVSAAAATKPQAAAPPGGAGGGGEGEARPRRGGHEAAGCGAAAECHDVGGDPLVLQPEALRPQQD